MADLTLTLSEALARAVLAYNAGKLAEAEQLCQQIIAAKHNFFDALHLLALVQSRLNRKQTALASYDRALAVRPDHAEVLFNYGNTLYELKRFEEALTSYDRALIAQPNQYQTLYNRGATLQKLKRFEGALASYDRSLAVLPGYAEALYSRGNTLHELKMFEEAVASYDLTLAVRPDYADVLYNRGNTLYELEKNEDALASYDRALTVRPDHAEALFNCGNVLHELKRFDAALASYDAVLALRPNHAEALSNRGNTLHKLKRFEEALASHDCALAVRRDYAEALSNRGNTLRELKRFEEALHSYERALAMRPDYAEVLSNRGNTLGELNRFDDALASHDRALALKPDLAIAYNNMGSTLKEFGRLDEARQSYVRAIEIDPNLLSVYVSLAYSKTFAPGDPHLAMMEMLAAKIGSANSDRFQLDFALAKAYADLKDHRRSFQRLLSGNAGKRATISYDEESTLTMFDRIAQVFTSELIAAKSGMGDPSRRPIFIIGMPRSGTTLVEQIIASHPMVHGAGELQIFNNVVLSLRGPHDNTIPYPEFVSALGASALMHIGAGYVAAVRKIAPLGEHVTDKMPSNYYFAGLIHLALPNAKIIHTVRDPIDTCLSCFSRLFAELDHTYDLGEIGRYYKSYQRLMAHWQRVLPAGRILDVSYEDVVVDLEHEARRIVAHCELDWDERCLAFHRTERPVRTASAMQVRQPIYKSAVGRWRVYEPFLGSLLAELKRWDRNSSPTQSGQNGASCCCKPLWSLPTWQSAGQNVVPASGADEID